MGTAFIARMSATTHPYEMRWWRASLEFTVDATAFSGKLSHVTATAAVARKHVTVHTDGSCLGNPGAGGWAAVLEYTTRNGQTKTLELSGGEANTTNNRMELMAAICALEALKEPCEITLRTDSKYVQHAFTKRWLEGWQRNGWVTSTKEPVKNKDLWVRLLELTRTHNVRWDWTKGHAGDHLNERCDVLARTAAKTFL
jgi:ribonuclease HI